MSGQRLLQVTDLVLLCFQLCKQCSELLDRSCLKAELREPGLHAVHADLVHFVQLDKDLVIGFLRETAPGRHALQDPSVIDNDGKSVKSDSGKQLCRCEDQLDLCDIGGFAQDVDIALIELTETSPLRSVRAEDRSDLQRLEGLGQIVHVIGIISDKRNGQIVAKAGIGKIIVRLCFFDLQLLASFQDLEDQLLIVAALLAGQVRKMLHDGRFHGGEAEFSVGLLDQVDQIVPDLHLIGHDVLHAVHGFLG